jgi:hypothetical protein
LLSKDTLTCASMPANSCNPNISCTWYTGIGTFLILLHVAGHFEATNWLLQKAKRRWVRASRVTSQCNKLKDALSYRRLRNWLRNRTWCELKNRYPLCVKNCFSKWYKNKSDNSELMVGWLDRI